ncbi:hypothetical protein SAMN05421505_12916 [Sinosporangium album]|uniref:Uncharacterized protein n=1 Tax=Sinosporangium album TaxID=504805 RepID=A0A1G8GTX1_9ACTN|nr:hypothetical protein SAMN05421505_12916 [Sinosporangium album]
MRVHVQRGAESTRDSSPKRLNLDLDHHPHVDQPRHLDACARWPGLRRERQESRRRRGMHLQLKRRGANHRSLDHPPAGRCYELITRSCRRPTARRNRLGGSIVERTWPLDRGSWTTTCGLWSSRFSLPDRTGRPAPDRYPTACACKASCTCSAIAWQNLPLELGSGCPGSTRRSGQQAQLCLCQACVVICVRPKCLITLASGWCGCLRPGSARGRSGFLPIRGRMRPPAWQRQPVGSSPSATESSPSTGPSLKRGLTRLWSLSGSRRLRHSVRPGRRTCGRRMGDGE